MCALEPLEARVVLSYTPQMLDEFIPGLPDGARIGGVSDDGAYIWSEDEGADAWIYADGELLLLHEVEELASAEIVDINDLGMVLAQDDEATFDPETGTSFRHPFTFDLTSMTRVDFLSGLLEDSSYTAPEFEPVEAGESGTVLLNELSTGVALLVRNGALVRLWSGVGYDINASDQVVGVTSGGRARMWSASEGIVKIDSRGARLTINDSGVILPLTSGAGISQLSFYEAGERIEYYPVPWIFPTVPSSYRSLALNESDFVLVELTVLSSSGSAPIRGLRLITSPYLGENVGGVSANGGGIYSFESPAWLVSDGSVYTDRGRFLREVTPIVADSMSRPQIVHDQFGPAITFLDAGEDLEWRMMRIRDGRVSLSMAGLGRERGLLFVDPTTGQAHYLDAERKSGPVLASGVLGPFARVPTVIYDDLAGVVNTDGRAHAFELHQSIEGERFLRLYFETGEREVLRAAPGDYMYEASVWSWSDLTSDHLTPQGLATPDFASALSGYATPWGGMNIAGLNSAGEVEVVWWAPGMELWSVENLSQVAGAPTLVGEITSYVTPWGGVNIAGTDASGNIWVIWWAPELGPGNWQVDNLTEQVGGPAVTIGSTSAYVTDWNGLNIAATDATTGELLVYWWTPSTNVWVAETIQADAPIGRLGPLDTVASGTTLSIAGVDEDGHVKRIWWQPSETNEWRVDDLTELAVF